MLQVSDVLGVSLKLELKIGHGCPIFKHYADGHSVPMWTVTPPLCGRTPRNYTIGVRDSPDMEVGNVVSNRV